MHHRRCSQLGLEHRRQVQPPSHLQPPECCVQRQPTCRWVPTAHWLFVNVFSLPSQSPASSRCWLSGSFTQAILQPVLSKCRSTRAPNAGMDSAAGSSEAEWVLQPSENTLASFQWNRTSVLFSSEEASDGPAAKRRRQEEPDLTFLQVKNKDGQDGLFVDLGTKKKTFSPMFDAGVFIPLV